MITQWSFLLIKLVLIQHGCHIMKTMISPLMSFCQLRYDNDVDNDTMENLVNCELKKY
jgi:hypothetical protein